MDRGIKCDRLHCVLLQEETYVLYGLASHPFFFFRFST